ncbi:MAG: GPW/gp25 family protein [Phycisphaerales bacterium]
MITQKRDRQKAFLGVGWAFPLRLDATDRAVATVAYEADVREAICIILGTNRGERVMRPRFGAGLRDFVFQPVSTTTMERIRTRVLEALVDWEPRIDIDEVKVEAAPGSIGRIDILLRYRLRATNTLHNLVYPFYLDEGAVA